MNLCDHKESEITHDIMITNIISGQLQNTTKWPIIFVLHGTFRTIYYCKQCNEENFIVFNSNRSQVLRSFCEIAFSQTRQL